MSVTLFRSGEGPNRFCANLRPLFLWTAPRHSHESRSVGTASYDSLHAVLSLLKRGSCAAIMSPGVPQPVAQPAPLTRNLVGSDEYSVGSAPSWCRCSLYLAGTPIPWVPSNGGSPLLLYPEPTSSSCPSPLLRHHRPSSITPGLWPNQL